MKTCPICKYTMEQIERTKYGDKEYVYWECSGCGLTLLYRDKK